MRPNKNKQAASAANGSGDCATPTERSNASLDKAAIEHTRKRRLCRTASRDCATPTERCWDNQDGATFKTRDCAERQAVPHRLNAVMLARIRPQWKIHARGDGAERQVAIVPDRENAHRHQSLKPHSVPARLMCIHTYWVGKKCKQCHDVGQRPPRAQDKTGIRLA